MHTVDIKQVPFTGSGEANAGMAPIWVYHLPSADNPLPTDISPLSNATLAGLGIFDATYDFSESAVTLAFVVDVATSRDAGGLALELLPSDMAAATTGEPGQDFIMAAGDSSGMFVEHKTYSSARVALSDPSVTGASGARAFDGRLTAHVLLMLSAWAVLVPLGICAALYGLPVQWPHWFALHRGSVSVALLLALAAFFSVVSLMDARGRAHFSESHHQLGLAVMLFLVAQVAWGIRRPHKPALGETASAARTRFAVGHRVLAFVVWALGLYTLYLGNEQLAKYTGGNALELFPGTAVELSTMMSASLVLSALSMFVLVGGVMRLYNATMRMDADARESEMNGKLKVPDYYRTPEARAPDAPSPQLTVVGYTAAPKDAKRDSEVPVF